MSKPKTTRKTTTRTRKPAGSAVTKKTSAETRRKAEPEDLCVFAFRLSAAERDAIHKAAGPGKASRFARNLLTAAARKDETAVGEILKAVQS